MISISNLKYSNNGWVLSGEIISDETIEPNTVHIKIYDALEHYETDFNRQYTYNLDYQNPLIDITGIDATYYDTSDDQLIRQGFQYLISNKTITFRITARGKSNNNTAGYYDYVDNINSERIGFNIAIMSVSLNNENEETFKLFLSPKLISSKPFRIYDQDYLEDKQLTSAAIPCPICNGSGFDDFTCPACNDTYYMFDRVDFNYGSDNQINGLYVNNHIKDCSAKYTRKWNDEHKKYEFTYEPNTDCWKTPKYGVLVSAYIPKYICDDKGLDKKLLSSRSSTLTNDLNNNNILQVNELTSFNVSATILSSNNNSGNITEEYTVYLYQQNIEITGDTQQKIRNNVVRFGVKTND